ncbi:G-protein coupled receptor GRL101-like [Ruditapes philippinarum]|uniref:G-protein coupled receptor GRL101-like n=1 Tax=Ruditapes philippinarum TaxID=129788 RepID=UPI00295BBEF2|nr:G-protein coupled receptor GRL101-like [Ruditapes philippinarum]
MNNIIELPKQVRLLDLSFNTALKSILQASYLDLKTLARLNVSHCGIEEITHQAFLRIKNIKVLDLRSNNIRKITSGTFSQLRLNHIYLSGNSFIVIEDYAFNDMSVNVIDFETSSVAEFSQNIFTGLRDLKVLRTPAFKFCCIRPNYVPENNCYPYKDAFSSCEDLMRLSILQTMLWLVGLSAFFGNILSLVYRLKYDRSRLKLGFGIFVTNLAVADFLMGVYLIIVAAADAVFRKRYIFNDDYWRNSVWCNLAGVLAACSSEASVLFLCLITVDRLLVIKFPFGQFRFDAKKANTCSFTVWLISLTIALVPIIFESYFQNRFYNRSGVCIALPFTRDRPPGWLYSVTLFIGFNFATFLLIAFGQWSIFMEVRKSSVRTNKIKSARKKDLVVARNLLLVVTTDFLCWFPIGVMGIMALNGYVISGNIYAWTAVFILPINSALNPVLYTLTALLGNTKFNPDTEEQNRTEMTRELGNYFKDCRLVNKMISVRRIQKSCFKSVTSVLEQDYSLSTYDLVRLTMTLFKLLDVIQRGSLAFESLNKDSVYIKMKGEKITGNMKVLGEPRESRKSVDIPNNTLQAAVIIHSLMRQLNFSK